MSETLSVSATLTATDGISPVVAGVMKNIEALRTKAKSLNNDFSKVGRSIARSMDGVTRANRSAADQMRGLSNVAERAAASYRSSWAKADQDREKSARRMYAAMMSEERQYQALVAKRSSAGTSPARGGGTSVGKIAGGTFLGVGAASAVRQLSSSVVSAERNFGRGIASAFRERLRVAKAETSAETFADLSSDEIRRLRKSALDHLGIKFGTGIEGTLSVATELSKAGIGKQVLGEATELALKAKTAMDISAKDTAELFGGLASFIAFDKARYASISNSIAIANKDTKASGTDIVEGVKRGLSAIATTGGKLTPEQLAGLVGTAIDVGIQPGKSGNFVSHFVGGVASADTAHGQRAKDMQEAAHYLGFGGRYGMAQSMRSKPMESIYKIFDNLAKLPEKLRIRVAKDLGGEQWFDEILSMVLAKDKLKQVERDIETDKGFLDKAALKSIMSMSGAAASVMAAAKLAQEKIGGGLDKAFTQIADAILRHADSFNWDSIKDHFEALTDGIIQGFGLKDWGQAVDWLASQFSPGTIETWKSWGRGFAAGIKAWGESLLSVFNVVKFLTGGNNPEGAGRLAANLTALAASLVVVNPLILLIAGAMALLNSPFALFIASVIALKRALDWVADKMFSAFVSVVDAIKNVALSMINRVRGWIGLSPIGGEGTGGGHGASGPWEDGSVQKQSFLGPSNGATASFQKASYSSVITNRKSIPSFTGRYSVDDLTEQMRKIGATVERASFISSTMGGFSRLGTGSGGGGVIAGVPSVRSSAGGGAYSLFGSTPGGALPDFAAGRSGSVIRRGTDRVGDVSIPHGGVGDMSTGHGLSGNAFLAARRERFARELQSNPALKKQLAAVIDLENPGAGTAVAESLMNRMDMNGGSIAGGLGFNNRGRSFYGPVRKGLDIGRLRELERDPKRMAARMRQIDEALAGSNYIRGHTDQGSAGDPNYIAGGTGVNINRERFNDWGGGKWGKLRGHAASRAFREWLMNSAASSGNAISKVPSPAEAIKNVPPPPAMSAPIRGDFGPGAGGGATIHIHGQQDPNTVATLVQRRIDESMNWRAHDSESEYT
ncbi:phage tail tape measure protein [Bradyrhizobium sp. C-145]|uniref:phage tail tape measure protein n=1 Tax=Bradyrhizobium sp. C-145 TaxID=574727 RepID=UPI00201B8B11|nr:phage tail tape measure protein [Bradyrhizobium sp. C-145]UQR64300.1 phage tail tape measure protein [Bradyrhizobium sp. C-145]